MHARSTTVTAATEAIDDGIRFVQTELLPDLLDIEGCVGVSTLVDRHTNRCITTSAWESADAMRASSARVAPLRDRYVEVLEADTPIINEWEVAIMHRDHRALTGACARVSWLQGDPFAIDDSIDAFRQVLPTLEALPGFGSASLLLERASGRAVSTVVYDSTEAATKTRAQTSTLRSRVAEQAGADILEVAEFDLEIAHLRVPELV